MHIITPMPRKISIGLLALLLALVLTACAGQEPAPQDSFGAQDCLWVLWIKDPGQARDAAQQVASGRSMILVARQYVHRGTEVATLDTGCAPLADLPLGVVEVGRRLALGQVSQIMELRGGSALVMRGTDRYRMQAQQFYAQKRYQEAQDAALQDVAINPASIGSWLVLGRSRAAQGEPSRALKAYEQGLLIDRDNPELLKARAELISPGAPVPAAPGAVMPPPPSAAPAIPPAAVAPAAPGAVTPPPPPPAAVVTPAAPAAPANGGAGSDTEALVRTEEARQLLAQASQFAKDGRHNAQAEELVRQAVKQDPKLAEAWLLLAKLQEAKGQYADATVSYQQAAGLDPSNQEANAGITRSFLALDKTKVEQMGSQPPPPPIARDVLPDAPKKVIPRGTLPDSATPPGRWDIYIQVASIKSQSAAQQEAKAWQNRGFRTRIWSWDGPDGSVWQRVLVGPYPTHDKARAVAKELKDKGTLAFYSLVDFPRD